MKRVKTNKLLSIFIGFFIFDISGKFFFSDYLNQSLFFILNTGFLALLLYYVMLKVYSQNTLIKSTQQSEFKFRRLFEAANDAIYLFELTEEGMPGRFVEANPTACERFGYSREELLTMSPLDITSAKRKEKVAKTQEQLLTLGKLTFEGEYVDREGNKIPSEIHVSIFDYKNKKHALAISRDIRERKKTEELIYQMAYYDMLTCLPNRRLFEEKLAATLKESLNNPKTHCVMFIDLDGFKQINDNFGHDVGDALLQAIASRLKNIVRENDLVSRRSGDEFTLLLPDITREDAIKVAERILSSFIEPFMINDHKITSSCSIGISFYANTENNLETIMRNADLAMYEAKNKGKNAYHVYE